MNAAGRPVDERGRPLVDAGGRLLPPSPRTPVCEAVSERFGMRTYVDGGWYRCCAGRVRKLIDSCSYRRTLVIGDRALAGYCYAGRTVFCVLYYDTKVPC